MEIEDSDLLKALEEEKEEEIIQTKPVTNEIGEEKRREENKNRESEGQKENLDKEKESANNWINKIKNQNNDPHKSLDEDPKGPST